MTMSPEELSQLSAVVNRDTSPLTSRTRKSRFLEHLNETPLAQPHSVTNTEPESFNSVSSLQAAQSSQLPSSASFTAPSEGEYHDGAPLELCLSAFGPRPVYSNLPRSLQSTQPPQLPTPTAPSEHESSRWSRLVRRCRSFVGKKDSPAQSPETSGVWLLPEPEDALGPFPEAPDHESTLPSQQNTPQMPDTSTPCVDAAPPDHQAGESGPSTPRTTRSQPSMVVDGPHVQHVPDGDISSLELPGPLIPCPPHSEPLRSTSWPQTLAGRRRIQFVFDTPQPDDDVPPLELPSPVIPVQSYTESFCLSDYTHNSAGRERTEPPVLAPDPSVFTDGESASEEEEEEYLDEDDTASSFAQEPLVRYGSAIVSEEEESTFTSVEAPSEAGNSATQRVNSEPAVAVGWPTRVIRGLVRRFGARFGRRPSPGRQDEPQEKGFRKISGYKVKQGWDVAN